MEYIKKVSKQAKKFIDKQDKKQLITKGAIEEILEVCKFVEDKGQVTPITPRHKKRYIRNGKTNE